MSVRVRSFPFFKYIFYHVCKPGLNKVSLWLSHKFCWCAYEACIMSLFCVCKFLFKPTVQSSHYPIPSFIRAQDLCHWESRWPPWPSSPSLIVPTVRSCVSESRGGRPCLPVPNKPYGLCGRKATLNDERQIAEARSCVTESQSRWPSWPPRP